MAHYPFALSPPKPAASTARADADKAAAGGQRVCLPTQPPNRAQGTHHAWLPAEQTAEPPQSLPEIRLRARAGQGQGA